MKKASIIVPYDEEKLAALRLYLDQKGQTVETELASAVDSLYVKSVPGNVREYIDLRVGTASTAEKKKAKTRASAEVVPEGSDGA